MEKTSSLNVLSLFDGISCGQIAIKKAGFEIESYTAYEIDKYAIAITRKNYPKTEQKGDVLSANFKEHKNIDLIIAGSPCTTWSIAKNNREKDKSGTGWHLFMQFAKAIKTINPKYYLYENVSSMPKTIKDYISQELNTEPIKINSALVSPQQRNRYYWTNIAKTNNSFKTMPNIPHPEDKGILLKDIIDHSVAPTASKTTQPITLKDESTCKCATNYKRNPNQLIKKKCFCEMVIHKAPERIGQIGKGGQGERIYSVNGKSVTISANGGGGGAKTGLYKIDFPDGNYIIRSLTPKEAERCQTIPDDYTATGTDENGKTIIISNTQRYKIIGNGWTIDVIAHILKHIHPSGNEVIPDITLTKGGTHP